jgi:hypothetical protein
LGGQAAGREELSLQWGEGGKAVAKAILEHPEIGAGEIQGGAWPNSIDYYLPFAVGEVDYDLGPSGIAWFLASQYVVVTEPEIQRQFYSPEMIAWFDTQDPVAVVHDNGRVYARIFNLSGLPVPPPYYQRDASILEWGERVRLVASLFRDEVVAGAELRVRLYFETAGEPFDYLIEAQVVDQQGNSVGTVSKELHADDTTVSPLRSIFDVELPENLEPGAYELQISIRDSETGAMLKAVRVVTGQNARSPVTVGVFTVVDSGQDEDAEP